MTYRSSHELEGKTLCLGDKVILLDIEHSVQKKFLNIEYKSNYEVFKRLGIKDYRSFCSQHYGYDAERGDWPECQENDYEALTRVVMALFKIIEGKEIKEKENLFEAKESEPKPKIYKSLTELEGNTLKYGDLLVFNIPGYISVLRYKVCRAHLGGTDCDNDLIFIRLKIEDKADFCTKCYGYKATDAMFPYCKCDDYVALTKVAKELFKLCEASKPVCYTSYASLSGNTLKEYDTVKFGDVCSYTVTGCYLDIKLGDGGNNYIFRYLSVNKHKLAEECYGYKAGEGGWPTFKPGDYAAATRLVLALFAEFERQELTHKSTEKLIDELNEDLDDLLGNTAKDTIIDKSEFTFTHVKPIKIKF